jgi:hypothetical protein
MPPSLLGRDKVFINKAIFELYIIYAILKLQSFDILIFLRSSDMVVVEEENTPDLNN